MPFPVASILSAVTPLVLGAVDLYRRRQEATEGRPPADGTPLNSDALRVRLRELEESDLEQSRLIGELSRQVEALAKTAAAAQDERRRTEALLQRVVWGLGTLAVASLALSIWALAR